MFISDLLKEAPHVWKLIREQLIGNEGRPESGTGYAADGIVRETEMKHNAPKGSYWYRFFRPDDSGIGGTAKQYYATMTTVTEEHLLAGTTANTVPTGESWASFGWYCRADLGKAGYLVVKKENVAKSEIPARIVYRMKKPNHVYVDLDTYIVGHENASIDWIVYNGMGHDLSVVVIPLLFRIATRSALNLEQPIF